MSAQEKHATVWHVGIDARAEHTIDPDDLFDVMDSLTGYGASAALSADAITASIALTIEADSIAGASEIGVREVRSALAAAGYDVTLAGIEIKDDDEFARGLSEPMFPQVVGFAEIAEMAGVSRQRARQFTGLDGFPQPVIETAQGPLMSRNAVQAWLGKRKVRPGRPRKLALSS